MYEMNFISGNPSKLHVTKYNSSRGRKGGKGKSKSNMKKIGRIYIVGDL